MNTQKSRRVGKVALLIGLATALVCLLALESYAASASEIDKRVDAALKKLNEGVTGAGEITSRAAGMLVFPNVVRAGLGVGGEYGEGALVVDGKKEGYYRIVSGSVGFQAGAKEMDIVIAFMQPEALKNFRQSNGWEISATAGITVLTAGAAGRVNLSSAEQRVVAVVYDERGLMYNATLQGSKITPISPGR